MEKLLSIEDLSVMLQVSKATIYSWTSQKKIPFVKLGSKMLRFKESEIDKMIDDKSIHPNVHSQIKPIKSFCKSSSHNDYIEGIIKKAKEDVLEQ